jgi:hypothetical protein
MRWLRRHTWPWFALAVAMFAAAVLVLHGVVRSVEGVVAFFVFLAACIRAAGLAIRDDPVSWRATTNRAGPGAYANWIAAESSAARIRKDSARRARERQAREADPRGGER